MPKFTLEEKINRLAAEFAAQLVEAVKESSLGDLAALQSEKKKPGPKPGKKRGRKPGPKPGSKRKAVKKVAVKKDK
jgi:hypothetical protein